MKGYINDIHKYKPGGGLRLNFGNEFEIVRQETILIFLAVGSGDQSKMFYHGFLLNLGLCGIHQPHTDVSCSQYHWFILL
jgi:hypothetical protein